MEKVGVVVLRVGVVVSKVGVVATTPKVYKVPPLMSMNKIFSNI